MVRELVDPSPVETKFHKVNAYPSELAGSAKNNVLLSNKLPKLSVNLLGRHCEMGVKTNCLITKNLITKLFKSIAKFFLLGFRMLTLF